MKRDASPTGGGSAYIMRDVAPKHYASHGSHAAKLQRAMRYLGTKHVFARPVTRTEHTERVSLLDRWRAQRQA